MLADRPCAAALPASDIQRAKRFYTEKLGLRPEKEDPGGITFHCGGDTRFIVFPSSGKASGTHTQMGWSVDDIEAEVADLQRRGVVFEEYNMPELKTVKGVAMTGGVKAAWFKDTEGNLLSLVQGM